MALPEARRHGAPAFERHENLPTVPLADGAEATVVLGTFADTASPATVHTPIVGAQIALPAGSRVLLPLREEWEYALLSVEGDVEADAAPAAPSPIEVSAGDLLYLGLGRTGVEVSAAHDSILFLLGGEPFEDDIVMWWNFVGRSHDEIVVARQEWEADSPRFGTVPGHGEVRIPAPPLPGVRLTPRRRRV